MSTVGRMDGAFFVSRSELLAWVNSFFALSLSKVEQCANGAVYCQVIDASHPGAVPMRRVNWNARDEHQCIPNYKVLQQAFEKVGITRHIEVDKLVRGKYQDNLEMLQWIKRYFDGNYQGAEYDPVGRRAGCSLPDWAKSAEDQPQTYAPPSRGAPRASTASGGSAGTRGTAARVGSAGAAPSRGQVPGAHRQMGAQQHVGPQVEFDCLREEHEKMRDEVVDLKITVDGLETERDFYFQKLRDIEILCQTLEAHPDPNMTVNKFVENVQRILYAKDDEEDDDGLDDVDPP